MTHHNRPGCSAQKDSRIDCDFRSSADSLRWFALQLNNSWEDLQAIAESLFWASSNISRVVNNSRCEQKSLAFRGVCARWKFIFQESASRWIMKRGLWGGSADDGKWGHICGLALPPQMYYPATSTLRPLPHFFHDSPQIYSRAGNLAARRGLDNHLLDKFTLSLRAELWTGSIMSVSN